MTRERSSISAFGTTSRGSIYSMLESEQLEPIIRNFHTLTNKLNEDIEYFIDAIISLNASALYEAPIRVSQAEINDIAYDDISTEKDIKRSINILVRQFTNIKNIFLEAISQSLDSNRPFNRLLLFSKAKRATNAKRENFQRLLQHLEQTSLEFQNSINEIRDLVTKIKNDPKQEIRQYWANAASIVNEFEYFHLNTDQSSRMSTILNTQSEEVNQLLRSHELRKAKQTVYNMINNLIRVVNTGSEAAKYQYYVDKFYKTEERMFPASADEQTESKFSHP